MDCIVILGSSCRICCFFLFTYKSYGICFLFFFQYCIKPGSGEPPIFCDIHCPVHANANISFPSLIFLICLWILHRCGGDRERNALLRKFRGVFLHPPGYALKAWNKINIYVPLYFFHSASHRLRCKWTHTHMQTTSAYLLLRKHCWKWMIFKAG